MSWLFDTVNPFFHLKSVNNLAILKGLAEQLATKEMRDEMAIPAYFHGNILSRALFFGRLSWFLQPLRFSVGSSCLDFGCGIGLLAPYVVANGGRYCGIDLNPEIARSYAQRLGLDGVEFHQALQELPPTLRFDRIVSFDVLEHVDDLGPVFAQFRVLLKPGGEIVICGPTENWLYRLGRRVVGFSGEYHHRNIHDIFRLAKECNLTKKRQRSWPLPGAAALFECGYFTLQP